MLNEYVRDILMRDREVRFMLTTQLAGKDNDFCMRDKVKLIFLN